MSGDTFLGVPDGPLVHGWLAARSVARGLPAPVEDAGGWRVDTGLPDETRRYVFAEPSDGLRRLAHTIEEPRVLLKLLGAEAAMRPLLPERWRITSGAFLMTLAGAYDAPAPLPRGYEIVVAKAGRAIVARVLTADGATAASGHAAETEDTFVYDRIVTDPAHRRRGLARAVMTALGAARRSPGARQVLVATEDGRALYSTIGWRVHAPWTTAFIPQA